MHVEPPVTENQSRRQLFTMHMSNETCNTLWRVLIHIQMELLGFVLIFLLIKNPVFLIKKMELLNPWPHFRRNISLGHPFSKREYMKMWEIDHNIKSIWPQFLINIFVWLWLCYNLHVLVCKFSIGDGFVLSLYNDDVDEGPPTGILDGTCLDMNWCLR